MTHRRIPPSGQLVNEWDGPKPPPSLDHLGLEDYFAGKSSAIYYYRLGRWQEFAGMN